MEFYRLAEDYGIYFIIFGVVLSLCVLGLSIGIYETIGILFCISLFKLIPYPYLFSTIFSVRIIQCLFIANIGTLKLYQTDEPFVPCTQLFSKLKIGDAIEFERSSAASSQIVPLSNVLRIFVHWGIYSSKNTVVHLVNVGNGQGYITENSLAEVAAGSNCRINNLDKLADSLKLKRGSPDDILRRARESRLQEQKYHVSTKNCEHFVTYCLFGERISTQMDNIYEFYGKNFITDFLTLFVIYMGIYKVANIPCIWEFLEKLGSNETFRCFLMNYVLPALENVARFAQENEIWFIVIVNVILLPPILYFLFK